MNNKVSIIISVCNGEKYLHEAIESALDQDYPDKEVIVVNDGSTDKTSHIIKSFGSQIISCYQENRGLGAGRNSGVRVSKGQFLAFLDHDDLWEKTKLTEQIKLWKTFHVQDPLVFSLVKQFICPSLTAEQKQAVCVNENPLPGYIAGTMFLSRSRFNKIGYFFEENEVGEYIEWYQRAVEMQVPVILLDQVTLFRRVHLDNMGRKREIYNRNYYLKILKKGLDKRRLLLQNKS